VSERRLTNAVKGKAFKSIPSALAFGTTTTARSCLDIKMAFELRRQRLFSKTAKPDVNVLALPIAMPHNMIGCDDVHPIVFAPKIIPAP